MNKKTHHIKKMRVLKQIEKDIDYADKIVFVFFLALYFLATGILMGVIFN